MKQNAIFLRWHLGLGDAIICNGMVRELSKRFDAVILPAKLDKVVAVFWMFSDLENVRVVPVRDDSEMNSMSLSYSHLDLGLWSKIGLKDWSRWDEQLYRDAGVPFEIRWSGFKVPDCPQIEPPQGAYAFTHQEVNRGMAIKKMPTIPIYEPPKPPHIFWNLTALRLAAEIHVVNSCFLSLAESVPVAATRLVLHDYARKDRAGAPTLRKSWEILR